MQIVLAMKSMKILSLKNYQLYSKYWKLVSICWNVRITLHCQCYQIGLSLALYYTWPVTDHYLDLWMCMHTYVCACVCMWFMYMYMYMCAVFVVNCWMFISLTVVTALQRNDVKWHQLPNLPTLNLNEKYPNILPDQTSPYHNQFFHNGDSVFVHGKTLGGLKEDFTKAEVLGNDSVQRILNFDRTSTIPTSWG